MADLDKAIESTAEVAKAYVELAHSVSVAMLAATATQQKTQHANMIETAELCARILKSD